MIARVEFPGMRAEVVEVLRALSDPGYQRTRWGRYVEGAGYCDDFDLNTRVFYDDCRVLPSPVQAVPQILRASDGSGRA